MSCVGEKLVADENGLGNLLWMGSSNGIHFLKSVSSGINFDFDF